MQPNKRMPISNDTTFKIKPLTIPTPESIFSSSKLSSASTASVVTNNHQSFAPIQTLYKLISKTTILKLHSKRGYAKSRFFMRQNRSNINPKYQKCYFIMIRNSYYINLASVWRITHNVLGIFEYFNVKRNKRVYK